MAFDTIVCKDTMAHYGFHDGAKIRWDLLCQIELPKAAEAFLESLREPA